MRVIVLKSKVSVEYSVFPNRFGELRNSDFLAGNTHTRVVRPDNCFYGVSGEITIDANRSVHRKDG